MQLGKRLRYTLFAIGLACGPQLFLAETAHAQKNVAKDEIFLAIGETRTLPSAGIKEYSEGVKGVIDVVATERNLVVTGKKDGTTQLLLIRNDGSQTTYEITVARRNPIQVEKEIQSLTEGIAGIKTRRLGARVIIDGAVSTETELKRVQQIANSYGEQCQSIVVVGTLSDRKLLIRLDFFFVQYDKSSGYNVGLGWPASIGGGTAQAPVFRTQFSYDFISRTTTAANATVVNQPLPRLDIASRYGWAKVVKQSSVITSNGTQATFESGGESNFLQNVGLNVGLVSVKFGTNVTVLPRYDSITRDVDIKLVSDVADLTEAASAGGPPSRTTTKLDTQVTLKLGQALILSGIKTSTQRRSVSGLPGLNEIPILGLLFGSHTQEKAQTEGAVFIVPSVVDTVPKSAVELINNAMATYKEYGGVIDDVDTFPKTPPSAK